MWIDLRLSTSPRLGTTKRQHQGKVQAERKAEEEMANGHAGLPIPQSIEQREAEVGGIRTENWLIRTYKILRERQRYMKVVVSERRSIESRSSSMTSGFSEDMR